MGQIQTNFQAKTGANNLDLIAGPGESYASPYSLYSILYKRTKTEAINIIVEVAIGGTTFVIDRIDATGIVTYTFPNARVPYKFALSNGAVLRFRTENVAAGDEEQAVAVQWADFT